MEKKDRLINVIVPFVTNFLAVALGIVITFAVQGQVDKKHEKEGIKSGLNLAAKELDSNLADIQYAKEGMELVIRSAKYLYDHIDNLGACPADSINYHWEILQEDAYLTLPDDALQMLKSTFLYSDLLDRELAMSIVQAYDICDALQRTINLFREQRIASIVKIEEFFMAKAPAGQKDLDIIACITSLQGRKVLQKATGQFDFWMEPASQQIRATIDLINNYVGK